jgi:hypothetical protein
MINNVVFIESVLYSDGASPVNDSLYYTPVEISIQQDLNITPIVISGTIDPSFPFNNSSFTLYCGENYIDDYYSENGTYVNDITELIYVLNNSSDTSRFGVFSEGTENNIILTMTTSNANSLCQNDTLSFVVFSD